MNGDLALHDQRRESRALVRYPLLREALRCLSPIGQAETSSHMNSSEFIPRLESGGASR